MAFNHLYKNPLYHRWLAHTAETQVKPVEIIFYILYAAGQPVDVPNINDLIYKNKYFRFQSRESTQILVKKINGARW